MASDIAADPIPLIDGLGALSGRYDAILCDIWGVLHNGRDAFRPRPRRSPRSAAAAGRWS